MGRVIAVANQKGGVGKTTTAINLAIALSELPPRAVATDPGSLKKAAESPSTPMPSGRDGAITKASAGSGGPPSPKRNAAEVRTGATSGPPAGAPAGKILLIDLDPQGNATSGLKKADAPELRKRKTMYEALIDGAPLRDVIVAVREHVAAAPSSPDLVGAEIELARIEGRERRLLEALKPERDHYEFILIDTPPSLGLLTLNALVAADGVLAPMQCEYYALEGLSALLGTIKRIQSTLNPQLRIEGVALTMFDARNRLSEEIAREVAKYLPAEVFQAVIPRSVRLSESPSHGLSVLEYDGKSAGAEAYRNLAQELRARVANNGVRPESASGEVIERDRKGRAWSLRALFARSEERRRK